MMPQVSKFDESDNRKNAYYIQPSEYTAGSPLYNNDERFSIVDIPAASHLNPNAKAVSFFHPNSKGVHFNKDPPTTHLFPQYSEERQHSGAFERT